MFTNSNYYAGGTPENSKIQKIKNKVNEVGQGLYDLGWGMKTHAEFEREIYGKDREQPERETI